VEGFQPEVLSEEEVRQLLTQVTEEEIAKARKLSLTPLKEQILFQGVPGSEIVIGAGGGIHAHPKGPVAGARAFRQAIDATMQGVPLEQAAVGHEELRIALEEWVDPFKGLEM